MKLFSSLWFPPCCISVLRILISELVLVFSATKLPLDLLRFKILHNLWSQARNTSSPWQSCEHSSLSLSSGLCVTLKNSVQGLANLTWVAFFWASLITEIHVRPMFNIMQNFNKDTERRETLSPNIWNLYSFLSTLWNGKLYKIIDFPDDWLYIFGSTYSSVFQ